MVPHACRHAFTLCVNFSVRMHLKSKVVDETGGKLFLQTGNHCFDHTLWFHTC